jgi:predicted secreted protein
VQVGDEVVVTLPETATTGFMWHPDVDESLLRLVSDSREADVVPRGAPGLRVFVFEAVAPGVAALRCVKRRPWESEAREEWGVEVEIELD